ncbi:MAG: hypothetical protein JWN44_2978 [Myxococcales bacterium]|nr:hypothetical protein [Myxococcales bacterium]
MIQFIADPALVTVPDVAASAAQKHSWLAALSAWLNEAMTSPFQWSHFHACSLKLFEIDRAPTFPQLRRLIGELRQANVECETAAASLEQVVRRISEFFLDEARDVREHTHTRDALIEDSVTADPVEFLVRNASVRSELETPLACVAHDVHARTGLFRESNIVTMEFANGNPTPETIRVTAQLSLVDPSPNDEAIVVDVSLPAIYSPDELVVPDVISIPEMIAGDAQHFVVTATRMAHRHAESPASATSGTLFWRSLSDSHINTDPSGFERLLKVAAVVVADRAVETPALSVRPIRESLAANAKQLVRAQDGASAWRVTVVKAGAGWRLHYWRRQNADGTVEVELANVVRKNDAVVIPA